jgi:hypothetical protein
MTKKLPSHLKQDKVDPASNKRKDVALKKLAERRANKPSKVNNAGLYAGSPMYFYCVSCGHASDVLPESYTSPPKKLCEKCQFLKDSGWLE